MKWTGIIVTTVLVAVPGPSRAQVGGNIGFAQGGVKQRAEQNERGKRVLAKEELPPSGTSMFVDANVLLNVKADEYVAVFAVSREGQTVAESGRKVAAAVEAFTAAVKALGVGADDIHVDYVAQSKLYSFDIDRDVAREKLAGFELKKNVSVRFRDRALIDKLTDAAAGVEIHDLVKVDYVVKDLGKVRDRLMDEAAAVIKRKKARYEKLLDLKLIPPAQVLAERSAAYYPSEMYDSYVAAEGETMGVAPDRQRIAVQSARRGRTFFFNGLDGDGFDAVIEPVILEPVVQFTLYLKVRYEIEQPMAK
ncbi:SIMPL domain-containing protein [Aquisphaera insulae]|uniref:SIMPL domain-containing protein n=1 Tax=Aquisphaera insulae TaxID=2712864 RepID=UPI0013EA7090|nr:SIMPL domain-containing protein [Aquisphaera insulae]